MPGPTEKAYPPPGGPGTVHWLRLATYGHGARRSGVLVGALELSEEELEIGQSRMDGH